MFEIFEVTRARKFAEFAKVRTLGVVVSIVVPLSVVCAGVCFAQPGNGGEQEFSLQMCLEKGLKHYQANEYGTAILYFDRAKMLAPDRADINFYLGSCHDHTGDRRNAKRFYDKCVQLDPAGTFGSAASSASSSMMKRATAIPEPTLSALPNFPSNYIPRGGTYPGASYPAGGNLGPPPSFGAWPPAPSSSGANRNSGAIDTPMWPPPAYKPGSSSSSSSSDKAKQLDDKVKKQIEELKKEQEANRIKAQQEQAKPFSVNDQLNSVVTEKDKKDKDFSSTLEILNREAQIEADNAKTIGDAGSNGVKLTATKERERIQQLLQEELASLDHQMKQQLRAGNVVDAQATQALAEWIKRKAERDLSTASEVGEFKAKAYANWKSVRQKSISDSACNLLTQIRSQKERGGFGLQSVGTNLYTRQYGVPGALLPPVHPSVARVFPAGSLYDPPPNYIIPEDAPRFQHPAADRDVRGAILKSDPKQAE